MKKKTIMIIAGLVVAGATIAYILRKKNKAIATQNQIISSQDSRICALEDALSEICSTGGF